MSDEAPGTDDRPPPGPAGPPAAGSRVAGYRLQEQIGQGGMAVVFRAEDKRLGRLVALKVLARRWPGTRSSGGGSSASPPLSQFLVCTFPADTCNSGNPTAMKTEPAQIVTTGDGSGFLKGLTWSGWGTATAQGAGLLEVDNCVPSCAQGTFTGYQATVTLSGLTPYGDGDEAYADMTIIAPGSPAPQESFSTGLVP